MLEGFWIDSDDLPIEYRVYCYAKSGCAQSMIASLCKISRPRVNKIIKQLVDNDYLEEVYNIIEIEGRKHKQKTKPILYVPTDKEYTVEAKLTQSTSGTFKKVEDPRLNLICVKYRIIEKPKKKVPGHHWNNNNTNYLDYKKEFDCGEVTFRLINENILVIWIPERVVDSCHIRDLTSKIYSEVQVYANWFQKEFHCRVGLPSIYQDYHIAFPENDPLLRNLVDKHGLLKIIDPEKRVVGWWDSSKKYTEFETRDERIAETKAFAPFKIIALEDRLNNFENSIDERIFNVIENRVVPIIENKLNEALERYFSKVFSNSNIPDNFIDVV